MLDTKDIIILTASFYLGSVVAAFFKSLNDGILVPLLAPAAAAGKGVSAFSVKVGSAELKVGAVIGDLVNLIVSFALVVFTVGLLRTYVLSKIGARRVGRGDDM
jgi:large-conductance mechanosensitive channel